MRFSKRLAGRELALRGSAERKAPGSKIKAIQHRLAMLGRIGVWSQLLLRQRNLHLRLFERSGEPAPMCATETESVRRERLKNRRITDGLRPSIADIMRRDDFGTCRGLVAAFGWSRIVI